MFKVISTSWKSSTFHGLDINFQWSCNFGWKLYLADFSIEPTVSDVLGLTTIFLWRGEKIILVHIANFFFNYISQFLFVWQWSSSFKEFGTCRCCILKNHQKWWLSRKKWKYSSLPSSLVWPIIEIYLLM